MFRFIESPNFAEQIGALMTDDDYAEFQRMLAIHPTIGDVIPGLAGIRKVRWAAKGRASAAVRA
jgi:hypothetical protein